MTIQEHLLTLAETRAEAAWIRVLLADKRRSPCKTRTPIPNNHTQGPRSK